MRASSSWNRCRLTKACRLVGGGGQLLLLLLLLPPRTDAPPLLLPQQQCGQAGMLNVTGGQSLQPQAASPHQIAKLTLHSTQVGGGRVFREAAHH